ncbi:hypothetical protein POV27_19890 [Aureisphaera galaxeae]|uniref:hypothetical protein n=1 Tax=Aureisphaera galaxeae TaxID=1538023 RepID=UPI002350A3D7|nr:hypothetical protein [Aureisphaera galaxeae]MDC8006326.1 hypothetical protein [Aureisphaera galaxeae]
MLGIILIYFIGKYFYNLAEDHNKSKWGFAIAGVLSYYAGTFIFGVLFAFYIEIWSNSSIYDYSDIGLGLMAVPFGLLTCAGFYFLLKRMWKKDKKVDEDLIDDIGKSES